jgi:hypothetical protein
MRWPLCLTRWIGRSRLTHVHVEVEDWSLAPRVRGSVWIPTATANRIHPAVRVVDLGRRFVDVSALLTLTDGWTCSNAVWPHLRWWFLGGPCPMNCVRLASLALSHIGIITQSRTPDEMYEELRTGADHHAGNPPVA